MKLSNLRKRWQSIRRYLDADACILVARDEYKRYTVVDNGRGGVAVYLLVKGGRGNGKMA